MLYIFIYYYLLAIVLNEFVSPSGIINLINNYYKYYVLFSTFIYVLYNYYNN